MNTTTTMQSESS